MNEDGISEDKYIETRQHIIWIKAILKVIQRFK